MIQLTSNMNQLNGDGRLCQNHDEPHLQDLLLAAIEEEENHLCHQFVTSLAHDLCTFMEMHSKFIYDESGHASCS